MDWDDVRPKPKAEIVVGEKLESLSVEELAARSPRSRRRSSVSRPELAVKRGRVAAAEALFKD